MILATVVKKRGTKLWDNGLCGDKRNGERRYNRFTKPIDLGPSGLNIMQNTALVKSRMLLLLHLTMENQTRGLEFNF